MSKTNFANGSFLTPEFANAIFTHLHDGVDGDGHVSQIALASQVSGILPNLNLATVGQNARNGFNASYAKSGDSYSVHLTAGYAGCQYGYPAVYSGGVAYKGLIALDGASADPWVAGNTHGGCAAGMTFTDKCWVAMFALSKPSTGAIDFGFDKDATGAGLLTTSGFTYARRLCWLYIVASGLKYIIAPFIQIGNRFLYTTTPPTATSTILKAPSSTSIVLGAPPNSQAIINFRASNPGPFNTTFWDGNLGSTYLAWGNQVIGDGGAYAAVNAVIGVNASSQIYAEEVSSSSSSSATIFCNGWVDDFGIFG